MVELLFASHNLAKVKEVQALLAPVAVHVLTPDDVHISPQFEVDETGATFAANAELKVRGFAAEMAKTAPQLSTQTWVLSDDSGLVIDALNGEPGVYSKRYVSGTDHDRNLAVLAKLKEVTDIAKRTAHFVAIFCLLEPGSGKINFFEGRISGHITFCEQGQNNFGYDPIFLPNGYTRTFAEIGMERKNRFSHRAQAAQQLIEFFKKEAHA